MSFRAWLHACGLLVVLVVVLWQPFVEAQRATSVPQHKVEPFWPKPLPAPKDADGFPRQWVTGGVGGNCIDSRDHLFIANRGGLGVEDGTYSIESPPVIEFDPDGNVVNSWGNRQTLPGGIHGCFVDYEDNVWISGAADGIVQKWSHDGKSMLLQIGTKGMCDGEPRPSRGGRVSTCGEPGTNRSQSLLNNPADVAVDPAPDPVTGERGSIYIADGYGNHRIAVFDQRGNFLRQWGSPGSGPGQFAAMGGGHPHCAVLGNDSLLYTCDREQNRIIVFDRTGTLRRTIPVDPPDQIKSTQRAVDIAFSIDQRQAFIYVTDLGSARIWILERESGKVVGGMGRAGHMSGELNYPHTLAVDRRGNLFVAETGLNRRVQKFARVGS